MAILSPNWGARCTPTPRPMSELVWHRRKWLSHRQPCYVLGAGAARRAWVDRVPGVTLSREGAKSQTRGHKLRSSGTKVRKRVVHRPNSSTLLQEQLEA